MEAMRWGTMRFGGHAPDDRPRALRTRPHDSAHAVATAMGEARNTRPHPERHSGGETGLPFQKNLKCVLRARSGAEGNPCTPRFRARHVRMAGPNGCDNATEGTTCPPCTRPLWEARKGRCLRRPAAPAHSRGERREANLRECRASRNAWGAQAEGVMRHSTKTSSGTSWKAHDASLMHPSAAMQCNAMHPHAVVDRASAKRAPGNNRCMRL